MKIILRILLVPVLAALIFSSNLSKSLAAADIEVIRGFNLTVFGAEFAPFGIQSSYIRKFTNPVKFHVHNLSKKNRSKSVRRFILSLNSSVHGLRTKMVNSQAESNFNVYVVDKADYIRIAREKVYKRNSARIPGKCLVRSVFSRTGIIRSDAIVVSDGGEALFQRCLVEEILQGLGPLNEHSSLRESMFNDTSKHTKFTRYDRLILNMLYDKRIKNGANIKSVQKLLPSVLRDAKRRTN